MKKGYLRALLFLNFIFLGVACPSVPVGNRALAARPDDPALTFPIEKKLALEAVGFLPRESF